ncbi:MAG: hypothetical protein HC831_08065 [Chloroflexia bacterium]|nr:hypothetical protein [Chloroflexia bacterium]
MSSGFFGKNRIIKRGSFFKDTNTIKPRTVIVLLNDGTAREHQGITNPWPYIVKCKQNPDVKDAWIKND